MTRVAECDAQFRGGGDIPRPAGTHGRLEAEGHEAAFGEDAKRRGSEHSADPPWAGALEGRAPPPRLAPCSTPTPYPLSSRGGCPVRLRPFGPREAAPAGVPHTRGRGARAAGARS